MSDKYDRDPELDELLRPLTEIRPKLGHLANWQSAVKFELQQRSWLKRQIQSLPQLAFGLAAGFLIATWYSHSASVENVEESVEPSATILHVFAKSE